MSVTFKNNRLRPTTPKFLWPGKSPGEGFEDYSCAYPIDKIGTALAKVVGRKGWDIPGIDVEFETNGADYRPFLVVGAISGGKPGEKWRVCYHRSAFANADSDTVATNVSSINMPRQGLRFEHDGSRLTLDRYIGTNWKKDEQRFLTESRTSSKDKEKNKAYPFYQSDVFDYQNNVEAYEDDFGHKFKLRRSKKEPDQTAITRLFATTNEFLTRVIDDIRNAVPDHEMHPVFRLKELSRITLIPAPENTPELIVTERAPRFDKGILVRGSGEHLCRTHMKNDPENPFPERAYGGFSYGFSAEPYMAKHCFLGGDMLADSTLIFKVNLKWANDIFVADETAYEQIRAARKRDALRKGRQVLSSDELEEATTALARTMVPLESYDESYANPIYMIGRPLTCDEATDVTSVMRDQLDPQPQRALALIGVMNCLECKP